MKRMRVLLAPVIFLFLLAFSFQIAPVSFSQTAVYADWGSGEPNPPPQDSLPQDSSFQGSYTPVDNPAEEEADLKNPFDFLKQIIDNIL